MTPAPNATEMLNIEIRMLDIAISEFEEMGPGGSTYNPGVQKEVGVEGEGVWEGEWGGKERQCDSGEKERGERTEE